MHQLGCRLQRQPCRHHALAFALQDGFDLIHSRVPCVQFEKMHTLLLGFHASPPLLFLRQSPNLQHPQPPPAWLLDKPLPVPCRPRKHHGQEALPHPCQQFRPLPFLQTLPRVSVANHRTFSCSCLIGQSVFSIYESHC